MLNKITKPICFIMAIVFATTVFSQTTTINYLSSSLSASACNVFNSSISVNGVTHSSLAGGVSFNTTNGIILSTIPSGGSAGGTAYIIQYNFIPNNDYNISITAKGDNALYLKTSVVPNLNQFTTSSTTSCTPDTYVPGYSTVGYGQFSNTTSSSNITYSVPQFNIPGSTTYPYLVIWTTGGPTNLSLDVLSISQVVITKVAGLVLSPTSLSLQCGTTTAQTFTVSNPNNVANITSYEWNLGSSGNSWLYNGSVAPQNISTSTNSITLTPVCGNNLSNVSVTVKVNNQNYKTYSCTVSNTNPTLSINGSSAFCSGTSTYSINNLPCNTSVTWSISPAGPASLSCTSCSSTTLTLVTAGAATLTATVNGGCTPNTVLTKTIYLSIPTADFSVLPFNPDERFCINSFGNRIKVEPQPVAGVTSFRWGYSSYENGVPPTIYQDPGTTEQDFIFTVAGQYEIYATSENACGTGNAETLDIIVYDDCAGGFGFAVFNISPNPATGAVRVSSANQTSVIKEIRISDKAGTVKKRFTYTMNTKSVTINISSLPADVYYLQIFDGSKWVTKPIIKK